MARISWIKDVLNGKLGSIVGSSWNGIPYVKTYTKPKDPKSALQVAKRELFAEAVQLAHEAIAINGGEDCWQHLHNPEWQERVGLAKRRLDGGKSHGEALPLFPDGYKPDTVLSGVAVQFDADNANLVITALMQAQAFSRRIGVVVHVYNTVGGIWRDLMMETTIVPGGNLLLIMDWDSRTSYPAGASIEGASADDESSQYGSVNLPLTPLQEPVVPFVWLRLEVILLDDDSPELYIKLCCDDLDEAVTAAVLLGYTVYSGYTQKLESRSIPIQFGNEKQFEPEYVEWDWFNEFRSGASVQEQYIDLPAMPGYGLHIAPVLLVQPSAVRPYIGQVDPYEWELDEQYMSFEASSLEIPINYKVHFKIRTYNNLTSTWFVREMDVVIERNYTKDFVLPWNETNSYPEGAWIEGRTVAIDGRPYPPVEYERAEFEQEDVP